MAKKVSKFQSFKVFLLISCLLLGCDGKKGGKHQGRVGDSLVKELFDACSFESENPKKVEKLIKDGANINATDSNKKTPLMLAAEHKKKNVINVLIQNGADLNLQDDDGNTAVLIACKEAMTRPDVNAFFKIIKTLIEAKADLTKQDSDKDTALLYTCKKVATPSFHKEDYLKIVKALIDTKAGLNEQDEKEKTALMIACENLIKAGTEEYKQYHLKIVKALIDAGADLNVTDKKCNTAFMSVLQKYFKEKKKYPSLEHKDLKKLFDLLIEKADVNIPGEKGITPLMLACKNANLDIVKVLIKKGADINLKDKEGNIALMYLWDKDVKFEDRLAILVYFFCDLYGGKIKMEDEVTKEFFDWVDKNQANEFCLFVWWMRKSFGNDLFWNLWNEIKKFCSNSLANKVEYYLQNNH